MAYVTMGDLGQNQQQGWWDWFFSGSAGPPPKKAYTEASFKQQQAGANYVPNAAWKGMAFEAPADEDLDPFKAQGYDAAQAISAMGDVSRWGLDLADDPAAAPSASAAPAPAPVPALAPPPAAKESNVPAILATSLVIGGLGALLYGAMTAPPEAGTGRRYNGKRRN